MRNQVSHENLGYPNYASNGLPYEVTFCRLILVVLVRSVVLISVG